MRPVHKDENGRGAEGAGADAQVGARGVVTTNSGRPSAGSGRFGPSFPNLPHLPASHILQAHRRQLHQRVIVLEQSDPALRGQPPEKPAADERELFNAFVTARMLRLAERFARMLAGYIQRRCARARLQRARAPALWPRAP